MPAQALIIADEPTNRQIGRREASKPLKVSGRLKRALNLMVWENRTDYEAAVETGMTLTNMRLAFQRPHVRAYLKDQREVLRARECGRNIHTLLAVRDQEANAMARVKAVQVLEQQDDNHSVSKGLMPGFVVQIVNVQAPPAVQTYQANTSDD